MRTDTKFVFRKHMSVGAPDAEADLNMLIPCFTDTGDLDILLDINNNKCLILGRTGSGKSALIAALKNRETRFIELDPTSLSLSHISISTIIRFFENLGVHLDVFYKLLWTHILIVELIKRHYGITDEASKRNFITRILDPLNKDPAHVRALNYFEEWGQSFWLETSPRIHEVTERIEKKFSAALKLRGIIVGANAQSTEALTDEIKQQIITDGRKIVHDVQIRELHRLVDLLAEYAFGDEQQRYYIAIDKLDENWVDDILRYKLIRALVEVIRNLKKLKSVKIVLAIRHDLLARVFEFTKDAGFQLEKYDNYLIKLRWTEEQLMDLLNKRINYELRHKYTKQDVGFADIFPATIDNDSTEKYLLKRTLLRPRDCIAFVNDCFEAAAGETAITVDAVRKAEKEYSSKRLRSLVDEWYVDYPLLNRYVEILRNRRASFHLRELDTDQLDEFICSLDDCNNTSDPLWRAAELWLNNKISRFEFITALMEALYKVGCIGIKYDGPSNFVYCQTGPEFIDVNRLSPTSMLYIQRLLWAELKVNVRTG